MTRRLVIMVASVVAALACGIAALADDSKVALTAEGQAAAKAAVLNASDFGPPWTGGATKPDRSSDFTCPGFNPKSSDLVLTGSAASSFSNRNGLKMDSQADVLKTPHMVALEWQRSVLSPKFLPCLREIAAKQSTAKAKVISVTRGSFPRVAKYSARYRMRIDVFANGRRIPMFDDIIVFGQGRTEVTLSVIAPLASDLLIRPVEAGMADRLVARFRA